MTEFEKAARQALEVLLDSIDDVRDCLNQILPHAGYARYDRRIEAYMEQIAKHEKAIADLTIALEQQPAAQWVGLTDGDIQQYVESRPYYGHCNPEYREGIEEGARWADAKLREKNGG